MIVNGVEKSKFGIGIEETIEIDAAPGGEPMDYRDLNEIIH